VDVANKKWEVFEYFGPATYTSGGDALSPIPFGWGGFDWISAGTLDSSSTYYIQPVFSGSGAQQSVKLKWIVAATGVEYGGGSAVSGLTARLLAIGV
jgi:hypothetical protein